MSVIEQAVRDGVELAAGGAHIIEDENSAFFGYCRVWDLEQSTEFGCGDSFGPRGRLRRLAPGRRKDLTRDVSDARSRVVLASCPPVIAPTAPGQAPTEEALPAFKPDPTVAMLREVLTLQDQLMAGVVLNLGRVCLPGAAAHPAGRPGAAVG
jgi:hypothetical protein